MRAAAVAVIGFLIAGVSVTTAIATPVHTNVVKTTSTPLCVPRDAVAYQAAVYTTVHHDAVVETDYDRYSWTPGNHDNEGDAPDATASTPTSDPDHWQGDGKHDPKSDPIGSAFNKGNGDDASWFFWLGHEHVVKAAYDEQVLVTPEVKAVDAVYCQIAIYVYKKLNPLAPASWENSGPQTFIAMKNGTAYGDWYKSLGSLPASVCGDGWGYQQDASKSSTPVDFAGATMAYPYSSIVWPPIYAAKHGELSSLITVPACPPVLTEVTPTAPTVVPLCGPDNDTVTIPTTEGVDYTDSGWVDGERTITATAMDGYTLTGTTSWTFTDDAIACLVEVTPPAPTVVPICGPDNDTVSIPEVKGVSYSDTGWVDGMRTITATADEGYSLTGTTSWTFTDEATACPVTAVEATVVDPVVCGPNNDVITIPTTEGVTYSDTGWVNGQRTVMATANAGYVLVGQSSWTFYDEATTCPNDNTGGEVTAAPPTVVPVCFPNNDTVTIPEVQGVSYSDTGWVDGKRTITATPLEGYSLIGDTSWTFTDVPSTGCADPGPVFSGEDPALAFTGVSSNIGRLVAWSIALISGGMVLVARRRRAI